MKVAKKTSVGGAFARKEPYNYEGTDYEADIQNGDTVKILNKGEMVSGEYGDQFVFSIETRNGEKNANFNQSSINVLIDDFGEETEDWVGKEVTVLTKKGMFGGKKSIACYFVTEGWVLDDFGDLVKEGGEATEAKEAPQVDENGIPF
jgi:hypothetical protein